MAAFDPEVPVVNPPDWTRVSKPIQEPQSITKADTSLGILMDTGAKVAEGGVKLAGDTAKSYLKDTVEDKVNKLRDAYTTAYQGIKDLQTNNLIPNQTNSLIDAQQPQVPGGVTSGIERFKQIAQAQIQNAGKLNDTQYTMQLNALAKQLRNQYPGFRDYIDEQVKSVSGIDPANAVMRNLLEDINRNASNAKSEHDKVTAMVHAAITGGLGGIGKNGIPNAAVLGALWDAGKVTPATVYGYIAKYSAVDWQRQQEMSDRANSQGQLADVVTKTNQSFAKNLASDVQSALDITHIAGGTETAQGLQDAIVKANKEGAKVDPVKLEQGLMGLTALRTQTIANAYRKANEPDANGNTTLGLIGAAAVDQHIRTQLQPLDEYIKFISDEKLGFAHTTARQSAAIIDTTQNGLLVHPKIGTQMQIIAGMAKIAPQWGDAMYKAGLLKNLDKDLIPVYQEGLGLTSTQLDPLNPYTIKDAVQNAKAKAVNAGVKPEKLVDAFLRIPEIIADPKAPDEVKLNVARAAFDPKNADLMDEFKMDYFDPKKGYVPGKYYAYDKLFSDNIIDGMDKLRKTGGQGMVAWDNMRATAEHEFPVIFREDLHILERASTALGGGKPMIGKYDIHWSTDNSTGRFVPINVTRDMPIDDQGRIRQINQVILRVNGALDQLGKIQQKDGGSPSATSAYVLGILHNADPAMAAITKPLMTSIISAHDKKLQEVEDTLMKGRQ